MTPVVVVLLVVTACAGPSRVSLRRLVADQDAMSGRRVIVTGEVAEFEAIDGGVDYILSDVEQNRVLLLPDSAAAAYVGRRVEATGLYEFEQTRGRVLWVEEITPVGGG